MPSIKPLASCVASVLMLLLAGCGNSNSKAVFSPEKGHPSDWVLTHKTAARADSDSCAECHGQQYDGGIAKVSCMSAAPVSGFACHVTSPVATPSGCTSCHGGLPAGPFGNVAPNRKSAHAKHTALPGIGCDTCHVNAGSGTAGHAAVTGGTNRATVNPDASFTAAGAAPVVYNADGTCSNVSCHGGVTTPPWTGPLTVGPHDNSICYQCHAQGSAAGTPQFNSFYSGSYQGGNLHSYHLVQQNASCTDCHNIGALTNYQQHYAGVATRSLTSPAATIGGAPTKIGSYDSGTKTCSSVECHSFNTQWVQ
jgi:predicted CxxxxCH...CXXCH cytochrome family protein